MQLLIKLTHTYSSPTQASPDIESSCALLCQTNVREMGSLSQPRSLCYQLLLGTVSTQLVTVVTVFGCITALLILASGLVACHLLQMVESLFHIDPLRGRGTIVTTLEICYQNGCHYDSVNQILCGKWRIKLTRPLTITQKPQEEI